MPEELARRAVRYLPGRVENAATVGPPGGWPRYERWPAEDHRDRSGNLVMAAGRSGEDLLPLEAQPGEA